ncbi:restriction endonuclease subunit S, partial [Micrococcus luteus]|nr:restriction endonuclease subunit S [Micrococcus luteus]
MGWTETRLGHLLRFRSGDTITSQDIEPHGTYPVFGGNGRRGCAEDFNVDGDSILVGRVGALCGNVHRYVGKARVSEHALIAYPLVDWNRRWMAYLLDSMNLGQWSTGTAQPVLTAATLERLRVAVPSTGVQARIADYLDRETATIDALIEKQRQLSDALRTRRRAAVLARTGFLGVKPTSAASSEPWLESAPSHWSRMHVRRLFDLTSGAGFPPELQGVTDEELAFYKVRDLGRTDSYGRLG